MSIQFSRRKGIYLASSQLSLAIYTGILPAMTQAASNLKENAQLCISSITEIKETPVYF